MRRFRTTLLGSIAVLSSLLFASSSSAFLEVSLQGGSVVSLVVRDAPGQDLGVVQVNCQFCAGGVPLPTAVSLRSGTFYTVKAVDGFSYPVTPNTDQTVALFTLDFFPFRGAAACPAAGDFDIVRVQAQLFTFPFGTLTAQAYQFVQCVP